MHSSTAKVFDGVVVEQPFAMWKGIKICNREFLWLREMSTKKREVENLEKMTKSIIFDF